MDDETDRVSYELDDEGPEDPVERLFTDPMGEQWLVRHVLGSAARYHRLGDKIKIVIPHYEFLSQSGHPRRSVHSGKFPQISGGLKTATPEQLGEIFQHAQSDDWA